MRQVTTHPGPVHLWPETECYFVSYQSFTVSIRHLEEGVKKHCPQSYKDILFHEAEVSRSFESGPSRICRSKSAAEVVCSGSSKG